MLDTQHGCVKMVSSSLSIPQNWLLSGAVSVCENKACWDLVLPPAVAAQSPAASTGPQPAQTQGLGRAHTFRLHHKDGFFSLYFYCNEEDMLWSSLGLSTVLHSQVGNKTRSHAASCPPLCDAAAVAALVEHLEENSACIFSSLYLTKTKWML